MRLIILFFLFSNISASANSDSSAYAYDRYGIFFHFNLNSHSADFKKIPDCPNCSPGFESGSGKGFSIGSIYEFPYFPSKLISLRASYFNYSALLKRIETTTVIVEGIHQTGEFEHTFDSKLASIGVEPMISCNIFDNLLLSAGLHLGIVMQKNYDQKEEITKPKYAGTFLDEQGQDSHMRIRNAFSGSMQNATAINLSPMIGISYELPLNSRSTFIAAPEIFYTFGLLPIVSSDLVNKWNNSSLRMGLAIKYQPNGKPGAKPEVRKIFEKQEIKQNIDTVIAKVPYGIPSIVKPGKSFSNSKVSHIEDSIITVIYYNRTDTLLVPEKKKPHILTAKIIAVGLDSLEREIPKPLLTIEEFVASKLQPLLNYVFFDNNSAYLPERYTRLNSAEAEMFNENFLFHYETLPTYYHILNIVGSRMKKFRNASLRIVGCNSDLEDEKGNKTLSTNRAETIRNYFRSVWGLSDSRMKIESRNLSEKPSTPINEQDKKEENRRVEIYSDTYEILAPVFTQDTIREITPPTIRFHLESETSAGLTGWEIGLMQKNQYIKCIDSTGDISALVDWRISDDPPSIPRINAPLDYSLSVIDLEGHGESTQKKSIQVHLVSVSQKRSNRISDKEIDHYSLILFDFDKSEISGTNKNIIDFIKGRTKSYAKIFISGYTDRTGDAEYNKKLSERRSQAAKNVLGFDDIQSRGVGEDILLYDNDLPEARFYCRTVLIDVETDVK